MCSELLLCSQVVQKAVQRSMTRMQVETLDCVQFHWWDYKDKRYLDALGHLSDLQQEGVIRMFIQVFYFESAALRRKQVFGFVLPLTSLRSKVDCQKNTKINWFEWSF